MNDKASHFILTHGTPCEAPRYRQAHDKYADALRAAMTECSLADVEYRILTRNWLVYTPRGYCKLSECQCGNPEQHNL